MVDNTLALGVIVGGVIWLVVAAVLSAVSQFVVTIDNNAVYALSTLLGFFAAFWYVRQNTNRV
jgi:hypothetical protein